MHRASHRPPVKFPQNLFNCLSWLLVTGVVDGSGEVIDNFGKLRVDDVDPLVHLLVAWTPSISATQGSEAGKQEAGEDGTVAIAEALDARREEYAIEKDVVPGG